MPLSETIIVAITTFASGAIGAILGAIGTYLASKHSAKIQLQQSVLKEYFSARLRAFNAIYDAYERYAGNTDRLEYRIALLDAVNRACLVASRETAQALERFAAEVPIDDGGLAQSDAFHSARIVAFRAMDSDMQKFKMPHIIDD